MRQATATDSPDGAKAPIVRRIVKNTIGTLWRISTLGCSKGMRVSRYAMYGRLAELGQELPSTGRALSIGRSLRLCRVLGLDGYDVEDTRYPDVSILDLPYGDESFDCVVSDNVLEHVVGDPQQAMDECHRVLRPGGFAVHTTVMLYPIHGETDLWGFTPEGLEYLCAGFGRVVEAAGWGNLGAMLLIWLRLHRLPVPHARWHPAHWAATVNHPNCPIVTWVVAQKRP